ncbi:MAG: hypothetical protein AB7E73_12950 [Burkholderiales bacterium]
MIRGLFSMQGLRLVLLALALAAGAPQARAQMTGDFAGDMAILDSALAATVAATAKSDAEASRVAMEELYRQWRIFRAKNFEAFAGDPLSVADLEKVEAKLFDASQKVDGEEWAAANRELQAAGELLQAVRKRLGATAKPAAQ